MPIIRSHSDGGGVHVHGSAQLRNGVLHNGVIDRKAIKCMEMCYKNASKSAVSDHCTVTEEVCVTPNRTCD